MRGGFGMFANMWGANSYTSGVGTGWSVQVQNVDRSGHADLFAVARSAAAAVPNPQSFSPALLNGQGVSYFPYDTPMSYVEEWNFDIQHDIGHGLCWMRHTSGRRPFIWALARTSTRCPRHYLAWAMRRVGALTRSMRESTPRFLTEFPSTTRFN